MYMKKTAAILAASLALAACTSSNQPKALVLYYSQTGTTKAVAEAIAQQTGADIASFDITEPYTGDFNETIARCLEEQGEGYKPVLAELGVKLAEYDVIYLGYPIWFGTYAPPVKALLESEDFAGKTIVPFCTFGSGGLTESTAHLRAALPGATVADGYGVRTARIAAAPAEVERFLILGGYIDGEAQAYPDYSEQQAVTEAEAAIFDAACSGYQFPLGTPVTCGSRAVDGGMEYLFVAESTGMDGSKSSSKVHVLAKEGAAPEFTLVER